MDSAPTTSHAIETMFLPPYAKWYVGGRLNVSYNCVERHVDAGREEKVAYYWEDEPEGDRRAITFSDFPREVVRFANAVVDEIRERSTEEGEQEE